MEKKISLHIERLPEGIWLATSNDVQGLVAQGRTINETLEIARDVAKKLLEEQGVDQLNDESFSFSERFDFPLVVGF